MSNGRPNPTPSTAAKHMAKQFPMDTANCFKADENECSLTAEERKGLTKEPPDHPTFTAAGLKETAHGSKLMLKFVRALARSEEKETSHLKRKIREGKARRTVSWLKNSGIRMIPTTKKQR